MTEFIEKAKLFAVAAHSAIDQRRKYTNEPYWHHCAAVALHVKEVGGTERMVAAAWLHDVVEDTKVPIDLIQEIFGSTVADYVEALTDREQGNRKERKMLSRIRLGNVCAEVQTIKLADLIDNTSTIVKYDKKFAKVYMAEKRELVDVLTKGDKMLLHRAQNIIADYYYDKDE